MSSQKTLSTTTSCAGIGLHTGKPVNLTLRPARPNSGIVFVRTDLGGVRIRASVANVVDSALATTLGQRGARVATVEHVLAALRGLGIDNAIVELDAEEAPIMDGSAAPFVVLIRAAGIEDQKTPRLTLAVRRTVRVKQGDKVAELRPSENFRISYTIDFDHPAIATQAYAYTDSRAAFERELSRARTFGFLDDVEELQAKGLARGGSLDNVVVMNGHSILNAEGLRFDDEFVRHKVLDAVGDLSLVGCPIRGHLVMHKGGHALSHALLVELLSDRANYALVEEADPARAPGLPRLALADQSAL
jgi:UDP-3-O-[3-hydroxymyristoyl] N-acetylglucosamine deacetylase